MHACTYTHLLVVHMLSKPPRDHVSAAAVGTETFLIRAHLAAEMSSI